MQDYKLDLGWESAAGGGYRRHRFDFSCDDDEANVRSKRLKLVWDAIERLWPHWEQGVTDHPIVAQCSRRITGMDRPLWDEATLEVGMAVVRGDAVARVPVPSWLRDAADWLRNLAPVGSRMPIEGRLRRWPDPEPAIADLFYGWVSQLRTQMPIGLELAEEDAQEWFNKVRDGFRDRGEALARDGWRFLQRAGVAVPGFSQTLLADFQHSDDFRACQWRGTEYTFNGTQAAIIRTLYEDFCSGGIGLSPATLCEKAGLERDDPRIDHVFRHNCKGRWVPDPAWTAGMILSVGRGVYRLNLPQKKDKSTRSAT